MASEVYNRVKSTIGSIGAAQTVVEEFPITFSNKDGLSFSTSFDVLVILFKILDVDRDELVETITNTLTGSLKDDSEGKSILSKIEKIVKTALEANIINILNCNTNPIISNDLLDSYVENGIERIGKGIVLSVSELDFTGVLKRNPFSDKGSKFYFDIEDYNANTLYKSMDFNAYLWHIIHKSDKSQIDERIWKNRYPVKKNKKEENLKEIISCAYLDDEYPNIDKIQVNICGSRQGEPSNYFKTRKLKSKDNSVWSLNKTIFEFNHDFLMSIKLYDPKVIVAEIVEYFFGNANFTANLGLSLNEEIIDGKIQQLIRKIIKGDDIETNDCYYSFSNDEYDEMLEKSERYRLSPDKALSNLSNITSTSTLHDNKQTIKQTLSEVIIANQENPSSTIGLNLDYDWGFELLRMIAYPFVRPLFTPKVIFLLLVNQKIMGSLEDADKIDFEKIINSLLIIIKDVIINIKDLLIDLFLEIIIDKLKPLIELLTSYMLMETLMYYKNILMQIYNNCLTGWGTNINSNNIGNVNYADIYPIQVEPEQTIC